MNEQVTSYIQKQKSPQKEICEKLRKIIFDTITEPKEKMKWGVPSYLNGRIYFVSLKTHVNLGFSLKDLPERYHSRLEGGGKTAKHIKIEKTADINTQQLTKIIKSINY